MTKPLDLQRGSAPGSPKLVTLGRVLTTDARDSGYAVPWPPRWSGSVTGPVPLTHL